MVYLGQQDSRWSGITLGHGPATIGQSGCYLTAFTNIDNIGLDHQGVTDVSVEDVNAWFINNGKFVDGDELTDEALNGKDGCTYVGTQGFSGVPANLNWFSDDPNTQDALEIWINGNPARTHFVLYYSGHEASNFRIVDSWDGQVKLLSSAYGDPATIIQKGVRYSIPAVPAPTETPVVETPPVETTPPVVSAPELVPVPQDPPVEEAPVVENPAPTQATTTVVLRQSWFSRLIQALKNYLKGI